MKKNLFILFFLLVFSLFNSAADTRKENIDIYILMDKSSSMEEEIEAVKKYLEKSLIQNFIIPGDFLTLIAFYGNTEILYRAYINSAEDIEKIRKINSAVKADGRFTDIGNALDALKKVLEEEGGGSGIWKYMLLVTDGKQEAPKNSIYYSHDGKFNHAFLENTKVIQKEGWKIHILGIGTYSQARELAAELAASYDEKPSAVSALKEPESPEAETGFEKSDNTVSGQGINLIPYFIGSSEKIRIQKKSDRLSISLEIKNSGSESRNITVETAVIRNETTDEKAVIAGDITIKSGAGSKNRIKIDALIPDNINMDDNFSIYFTFKGTDSFTPSFYDYNSIELSVKKPFPLIPAAAAAASVLVFLLVLHIKNTLVKDKDGKKKKNNYT